MQIHQIIESVPATSHTAGFYISLAIFLLEFVI